MARIPRSFARRARSMASSFLATPSGAACACISIAPLRVCAFADTEKIRNIAASCDLMDAPFIEQVSLEDLVENARTAHVADGITAGLSIQGYEPLTVAA